MLGQGCLRALFERTIYFHLKSLSRFTMGFCQWAEMGRKVGFGCKNGSKVGRNPLFTHLKPISGFSRKPTFGQFKNPSKSRVLLHDPLSVHPIYGRLEFLRSFCRKPSMPIKIRVLGGVFGFVLGGEAQRIF